MKKCLFRMGPYLMAATLAFTGHSFAQNEMPVAGFDGVSNEIRSQETDPLSTLIAEIEAFLEKENVPGAGIAIVSGDEDIWIGGLGLADAKAGLEADANTLWRMGSTANMFVSLAMLKLQEQGLLDLEDTLRERVPDVRFTNRWEDTHPVRLVHILEHSAAIGDSYPNGLAYPDFHTAVKPIIDFNARSRQSDWRPGDFVSYSVANPPLAAHIVEEVSGRKYEQFVQDNILQPLEIFNAAFRPTPGMGDSLAKGYRYTGGRLEVVNGRGRPIGPSGDLIVSAREMGHLLRFFLDRGQFKGKSILSEESIDLMEVPTSTLAAKSGLGFGHGLNNFARGIEGHIWHGDAGSGRGFVSELTYLPEHDVGFVVMTNASSRAPYAIGKKIAAYLTKDLPRPERPEVAAMTKRELEKYTGAFRLVATRSKVPYGRERLGMTTITAQDGYLLAQRPGYSARFTPAGGDLFYIDEAATQSAAFYEDGRGSAYFHESHFRDLVRVSGWSAWGQRGAMTLCVLLLGVSIYFLFYWGMGRLNGSCKNVQNWGVRLLPGFAALSYVVSHLLTRSLMLNPTGGLSRLDWLVSYSHVFGWVCVLLACIGLYKSIVSLVVENKIHLVMKGLFLSANSACIAIGLYTIYWDSWPLL